MAGQEDRFDFVITAQVKDIAIRNTGNFVFLEGHTIVSVKLGPDTLTVFVEQVIQMSGLITACRL